MAAEPDGLYAAATSSGPSVRRTLVRVIMIVSSVAILLAGLVLVGYQLLSFRSRLVTDLSAQAEMLAENCSAALSFDDARDAEMILLSLRMRQPIMAAWVLDSDGSVFARYLRDDVSRTLAPPMSGEVGHRFTENRPCHLSLEIGAAARPRSARRMVRGVKSDISSPGIMAQSHAAPRRIADASEVR